MLIKKHFIHNQYMKRTYIYKINRKPEIPNEYGLPKKSINSCKVNFYGLEGDFNQYRNTKKLNDPDMALMILSMDILNDLNSEGWPVKPGDLGENLTLKNISYASIKPNQKYKIGNMELQISFVCAPCYKLKILKYVGKSKKNKFIKTLINRRGWYAKVLKEGKIKTGDPIQLIKK